MWRLCQTKQYSVPIFHHILFIISFYFSSFLSLACPWGIEYLTWKAIQYCIRSQVRIRSWDCASTERNHTHSQESPLLEQSPSFECLENTAVSGQSRHVLSLRHSGKTNIWSWSLSVCVRVHVHAYRHTQVQKSNLFLFPRIALYTFSASYSYFLHNTPNIHTPKKILASIQKACLCATLLSGSCQVSAAWWIHPIRWCLKTLAIPNGARLIRVLEMTFN